MDPLLIIFGLFFLFVVVLSPVLGAESRPEFIRPDRKARQAMGSMHPSDWDNRSDWPG